MLNKKVIAGLIVAVLAFLGIFSFALNGDEETKDPVKEEQKDDETNKDEDKEEPVDEEKDEEIVPVVFRDITKPVITILGDNPTVIEVGSTYVDAGATARDNRDGNITPRINVVSTVDTTKVADYTVTYSVRDNAGNRTTEVRTVKVVDTTKPIITLVGKNLKEVEVNTEYVEEGYNVSDNYDNNLQSKVVVDATNVDTKKLGTYEVKYNVTDANNNAAIEVIRKVKVVDTKDPVLTLIGKENIDVELGDNYDDEGATAVDSYEGDLTKAIVVTGEVNTNAIGEYILHYNVKDSSNNSAKELTRTINVSDNVGPEITIENNGTATYLRTVDMIRPIISVTDKDQVNETSLKYVWSKSIFKPSIYSFRRGFENNTSISIPNDYDGRWYLWIIAKDKTGNTTIKRSNAFYFDNTKPDIDMSGYNPTVVELGDEYHDRGATAWDNIDRRVNVEVSGSVNTNVVNTYYITYTANDNAGNVATERRTVHVIDRKAPTVSFNPNGNSQYRLESSTVVTVSDLSELINNSLEYQWTDSTRTPSISSFKKDFTNNSTISSPTGLTGTYYLWIKATDKYGNTAITRSNGFKFDNENPEVRFSNNGSYTNSKSHSTKVYVNDNYDVDETSLKYQWTDSTTVPTEVSFVNTFTNFGTVTNSDALTGKYYLWILAKDTLGNRTISRSNAFYFDNQAPSVSLIDNQIELNLGDTFADPGINYSDNIDKKYLLKVENWYTFLELGETEIVSVNGIDTNKAGEYTKYYKVTDRSGNFTTISRVIKVHDITPPSVSLIDGQMELNLGDTFADPGINYSDNYDSNDLLVVENWYTFLELGKTDFVSVDGVDTSKAGVYFKYYKVTDRSGMFTTISRGITVRDVTPPRISLVEDDPYYMELGGRFIDEGATATDNLDGDISSLINVNINDIEPNIVGKYTVIYNVTDASGNSATAERTVYVRPLILAPADYSFDQYSEYTAKKATVRLSPILTEDINPTSDLVNPNVANTYDVTYTYSFPLIGGESIDATPVTNKVTVNPVILDKTGPEVLFNPPTDIDENNQKEITVTVSDTSEVNAGSLVYKLSTSNSTTYTEEFFNGLTYKYTNTFTSGTPINISLSRDNTTYYLWILAKDIYGNTTVIRSGAIKNEQDYGPSVTFGTNGSLVAVKNISTTVTIEDVSAINASSLKYYWSTSTNIPSESSFVDGFTNGQLISSPVATGNYYLWILAKDIYDNTTIKKSNMFVLDNTGPTVTFSPNGDTSYESQKHIRINVTGSDLNTGSLVYKLSTSSSIIDNTEEYFNGLTYKYTGTFNNGAQINLNLKDDSSTYYLWVIAKDNLGNVTVTKSEAIRNS